MDVPIEWLLQGRPFVRYRTRRNVLGQDDDEPDFRIGVADVESVGVRPEAGAKPVADAVGAPDTCALSTGAAEARTGHSGLNPP